jgi:hypothetical protein
MDVLPFCDDGRGGTANLVPKLPNSFWNVW